MTADLGSHITNAVNPTHNAQHSLSVLTVICAIANLTVAWPSPDCQNRSWNVRTTEWKWVIMQGQNPRHQNPRTLHLYCL